MRSSELTGDPKSDLHPLLRVSPYALGFRNLAEKGQPRTWVASPAIPFRIHGLLMWGVTKDTLITRCQVRNTIQIQASMDPLPGLLFASALPFSELCAMLKGHDEKPVRFVPPRHRLEPLEFIYGWLSEHPKMAQHQLFRLQTLNVGDQVSITIEGPFHQLVFWGLGAH